MPECCEPKNERAAHHSEVIKQDIRLRLNKIEGQVRGVTRMVDDNIYCDNILNQITSIEAALCGVRTLLLEQHIKSCIKEQIQEGNEEVITELMKTIGRMIK